MWTGWVPTPLTFITLENQMNRPAGIAVPLKFEALLTTGMVRAWTIRAGAESFPAAVDCSWGFAHAASTSAGHTARTNLCPCSIPDARDIRCCPLDDGRRVARERGALLAGERLLRKSHQACKRTMHQVI